MRPGIWAAGLILMFAALSPAIAATAAAVPIAAAQRVFAEAKVICDRDDGRLWGHSLCGPMMLVDPASRAIVANHADGLGALSRDGKVWVGTLPDRVTMANSPTSWAGLYWTQILWPPPDGASRQVMIAHELFHRIQPDLGIVLGDGDNAHLDTLDGRYWLQLEWRALASGLAAHDPAARLIAVNDALAFRAERYRLFPAAAANERLLEMEEGVAEYTGVRLGLTTAEARTAYTLGDLTKYVASPTFVRSFAYATGPAYGLLLDLYAPAWRTRLKSEPALDLLLRAALPPAPATTGLALQARAALYGGPALLVSEAHREAERQSLLATLRARFVAGSVLFIPTPHINFEFNPQAAQPLDALGTVYPHLHASGDFGVLEADKGALLAKDFTGVTVSAAGVDPSGLKGDGWTLVLAPGWSVAPGLRPGDLRAVPPPSGSVPHHRR